MGMKSYNQSWIYGCAADAKSQLCAETTQILLKNATDTLSPEDEAEASQEAWVEGWPDGLLDEYQRYIKLLQQKKVVVERIMSSRGTQLHHPEVQMLERECTRLHNECLDASMHMRDSYTNVPEGFKSELNYLVNFDRFLLWTWQWIERD
jgi:hypothetical protein